MLNTQLNNISNANASVCVYDTRVHAWRTRPPSEDGDNTTAGTHTHTTSDWMVSQSAWSYESDKQVLGSSAVIHSMRMRMMHSRMGTVRMKSP